MDPDFGEGLLIDTGACDNLMGEKWLERVTAIHPNSRTPDNKLQIHWTKLNTPSPVGGVGKDIVHGEWRARVPISMPGNKRTLYEALYLPDNNTPALFGTKAMQRTNTILDLRAGKLHMWSGDRHSH